MYSFFQDKKICFLGDSITEHGHYIYNIRSFLKKEKINGLIFNGGIGGLSVSSVTDELLSYQVFDLKADSCVISFGVNDLGIWLYDSTKNQTEEIAKEIKNRNDLYFCGIDNLVKKLNDKGVKPVIMSPFPVNEKLEEKEGINTLKDNKEKGDLLSSNFYKQKTFSNINKGLALYNSFLKGYCLQKNILFIDVFDSLIQEISLNKRDIFEADGIHYNELGGQVIAREILKHLGCKIDSYDFIKDQENDIILEIEKRERATSFVAFGYLSLEERMLSKKEIISKIDNVLQDSKTEKWLKDYCKIFIDNFVQMNDLRNYLVNSIKRYLSF